MRPGVKLRLPDPDEPTEASRRPIVRITRPAAGPSLPGLEPDEAPKARARPFKLTPEKAKERPEQASIVQHLNTAVPRGFCAHVKNESFWSIFDQAIPNKAQRMRLIGRLKQAMLKDGFVQGFPDNVLFWPLPEEWRRILEAAGVKVPELVALAACFEVKRPGWTESGDKKFREGLGNNRQKLVHELLRRSGVPVEIVRDAFEADEAAARMGVPLRFRISQGAGGGVFRTPAGEDGEPQT
jgi:hypothetical protein